jgi:hypothetical protein
MTQQIFIIQIIHHTQSELAILFDRQKRFVDRKILILAMGRWLKQNKAMATLV